MGILKGYMTTEEAAEYHEVGRGTVLAWIRNNYIEGIKVNSTWFFEEDVVKNFKKRPKTGRPTEKELINE